MHILSSSAVNYVNTFVSGACGHVHVEQDQQQSRLQPL